MGVQIDDTAAGLIIGKNATSDKIGFFAATPVTRPASADQTALTDSTGGSVANATLAAITLPTSLTDNGGGTADGTVASMAAATTLTDNTGHSGSHDDTLAAVTVPADLTGGEDPTEAEHNELLAVVRVLAQNQSDIAQKVIELVTWQATVQNNFKEITTATAAERTAISSLTDSIAKTAELANAIRSGLVSLGLIKGSA